MRRTDRFESLPNDDPSPPATRSVVVPLVDQPVADDPRPDDPTVDEPQASRIYAASIHRCALAGVAGGALVLGLLGWAVAAGPIAVTGLGQWAVGGAGVGTFTGAGVGAAAGGLAGALIALFRLPRRPPPR